MASIKWSSNILQGPLTKLSTALDAGVNHFYRFLDEINTTNTAVVIGFDFDQTVSYSPDIKFCVVTVFGESPSRIRFLSDWAKKNPHVKFIVCIDLWMYDFPNMPANIIFVEYRQSMLIHLKCFHELFDSTKLVSIKNKKIYKKFSSLSFKARQSRAVVTATLLKYAKEQSIISYHREDFFDVHQYLINYVTKIPELVDLDWSFLNSPIFLDDKYCEEKNHPLQNLLDINGPAYQECLFVLTNETDSYGYHNNGMQEYNRPGPYLTEKTFKPMVAGNPFISVGQPNVYKFLKECYHIEVDYSIDLSYDNQIEDMERLIKIVDLLKVLGNTPLSQLIDQTIDSCYNTQQQLLDKDYTHMLEEFNHKQDQKILSILHS